MSSTNASGAGFLSVISAVTLRFLVNNNSWIG